MYSNNYKRTQKLKMKNNWNLVPDILFTYREINYYINTHNRRNLNSQ